MAEMSPSWRADHEIASLAQHRAICSTLAKKENPMDQNNNMIPDKVDRVALLIIGATVAVLASVQAALPAPTPTWIPIVIAVLGGLQAIFGGIQLGGGKR